MFKSKQPIEHVSSEHYSPCFKYEERVCVKSLLDRKQESGRCGGADSDLSDATHQQIITELVSQSGTCPDSPSNLSSSCSITDSLSEKYCVTRFCRSAGQPGFGSEEDKTSVIVFFFFWQTKIESRKVLSTDEAQ